jgi:hypothetical protein
MSLNPVFAEWRLTRLLHFFFFGVSGSEPPQKPMKIKQNGHPSRKQYALLTLTRYITNNCNFSNISSFLVTKTNNI